MPQLTEKEASQRFCPFTFACGRGGHSMSSLCMAWEWTLWKPPTGEPVKGRCGLIPEVEPERGRFGGDD